MDNNKIAATEKIEQMTRDFIAFVRDVLREDQSFTNQISALDNVTPKQWRDQLDVMCQKLDDHLSEDISSNIAMALADLHDGKCAK